MPQREHYEFAVIDRERNIIDSSRLSEFLCNVLESDRCHFICPLYSNSALHAPECQPADYVLLEDELDDEYWYAHEE